MTIAIRQKITVEKAGQLEIRAPELFQGMVAEVIVLLESELSSKAVIAAQLDDLLRRTQSLPQMQNITEEEIAEEIAAYRAGKCEDSD